MILNAIFIFFAFISVASTSPLKRAKCSKGPSAQSSRCCVWYEVWDDISTDLFITPDEPHQPCGKFVHESLRLSFHDAIGYSPRLFSQGQYGGGGADGSIIEHSNVEMQFGGNAGLGAVIDRTKRFALKYDVSYADIIQFAAASGITRCPGAPRLEFLAGRNKTSQPSPDGLLPNAASSVDVLLDRLGDAGFSPAEVVDLLASHTIGGQEHVDPSVPNEPFDSTSGVFDTQFYIETLIKGTVAPLNGTQPGGALSPLQGEFRLASDAAIARDSRTACAWQAFASDQTLMQQRFRAAMSKLALLGQNREDLVDCSEVIPEAAVLKKAPFLPAGFTMNDLEIQCPSEPFPALTADPGPKTPVHPEVTIIGAVPTQI